MKRSNAIRSSRSTMLRLVGDGTESKENVSSNFGPVRAGLITTRRTQSQVLTELLNSLDFGIAEQSFKFSQVLDTLADVTERLAKLYASTLDTVGTDKEE